MHLVSFCSGQRLTQTFVTGQSAEDKYQWCAQCSAENKTTVPLQCSLSVSETSLQGRQKTVRDRDHEGKQSSIFWTYRDPALRNSQQLWLATWGLISQHPVPRGGGSRAPILTEDLFTVNGCWGMESQLSLRVVLLEINNITGDGIIFWNVYGQHKLDLVGYWTKKREKWGRG